MADRFQQADYGLPAYDAAMMTQSVATEHASSRLRPRPFAAQAKLVANWLHGRGVAALEQPKRRTIADSPVSAAELLGRADSVRIQ